MSYAKVDIFYHIHQVAANVTKLVLGVHLSPRFWRKAGQEISNSTIQKCDGGFL